MRRAIFALSAALIFVSSANAQVRVQADPSALDPPMTKVPPSTEMGLPGPTGFSRAPYPAPLRDFTNPRFNTLPLQRNNLNMRRR
jgi:hypothetical protein